jgi:protein-tyrosine phosphatase
VHRLVFVCLGNINRSAYAEAVAHGIGLGSRCISVGLATTSGAPATRQARQTAALHGRSLEMHHATDWSDYRYQAGDLLLAMEIRHVHRLMRLGIPAEAIALLGAWASPPRLHLHDPDTLCDAYFRSCFALIESAVRSLAADPAVAPSETRESA